MLSLFGNPSGDHPGKALVLVLSGVLALSFQDALIKDIASQTSYWQFQAIRATGNLTVAVIMAAVSGGIYLLKPFRPVPVFLRAGLMAVCMLCFFGAAPFLTLTQMAAGLYTYPIFVSLLAGPVLREPVGVWRLTAVGVGAGGAALVLSPCDAGFSWVQCLPILAGFFYAANILTIRRACRYENTLAIVFAVALTFFASGALGSIVLTLVPLADSIQQSAPFVAIGWPTLTLGVAGIAYCTSVMNFIGNVCLSRAYQTADSSWLAPLDFSYLLFATFWGYVMFDSLPSANAVVGMVLIAAAGIVTGWREKVRLQTAPPA